MYIEILSDHIAELADLFGYYKDLWSLPLARFLLSGSSMRELLMAVSQSSDITIRPDELLFEDDDALFLRVDEEATLKFGKVAFYVIALFHHQKQISHQFFLHD